MKFEIPNRRTFYVIYWMFQSLIIFIGAHLILWHGEPEGFLEIFSVADYLPQYFIHVMVFFVLAIVLDHFHKQEYVKGVSSWLLPRRYVMYGVKTLVLPMLIAMPFAYLYFKFFGVSLDTRSYIQRVLPVFFMLVLLLNLIVLVRYALLRIAWMLANQQAAQQKLAADVRRQDLTWKTDMAALQGTDTRDREIEYSRDWVKYSAPLGRIAYCCVEHRSTMVYLDNGTYGRYAKSLTDLKDFIGSDPRFFSTGRWIVNRTYIEELEDSFSRKKFIVLRFPFQAKLSLPKEKVSEFRQWFDGVNQSNTPL